MIGGHDDQGVAVLAGEVQRRRDGLVQRDGLTDLTADVGRVILLVDRRRLHLQEESLVLPLFRVHQQVNGFGGHRGQLRLFLGQLGVRPAGGCGQLAAVGNRRGHLVPLHRQVALPEHTEHRVVQAAYLVQIACGGGQLVSGGLGDIQ